MKVELVAIERPDGLLVERLLDAGLRVLALHPNQVAAARARFRVSGGKSDRFDAFVLCELARTDHHRFRVLEPDSDQTKALRALTRAREDLVQTRMALSNQLRAELERFWPGPIGLFKRPRQPDLARVPEALSEPRRRRTLGEKRLQAFLARQRYSGRKHPPSCWPSSAARPRAAPASLRCDARRAVVLALVATLEPIVAADQAARAPDRARGPRAPRRRDLPLAVQGPDSVITAADAAGRDRRLPRPLPDPRRARRRRRPSRRRPRVRQAQGRVLPVGVQQAPARRVLHARRQHPPLAPLGRRPLRRARSPAATTTRARSAPSAAPGAASCGAAGKTAPRMTPPATAACNSTVTVTIPASSGPRPDLAATQRMLGDAVTRQGGPQGRAQRA